MPPPNPLPISRIARLREYGVFRDFAWPPDLADFGQYNLIYGWNWSGKTTLSRLFRELELRRSPTMGEAVLRIDGGEVQGEDFPQSTLQIRVFNRDFIHESVFPVGGGDVPPIFVVGKESVEKQKQADQLKAERGMRECEQKATRETKQQAVRDLDKHCIDRAKVIKDTLRLSGSGYNEYDKRAYQNKAQQMASEGAAAAHRLSDSQRESLLLQHRAAQKPKVSEIAYRLPELQRLADDVSALLRTTVVSAAIDRLKDDSALAEWVRHGLGLHKEHESDSCLFCEQPLPERRLAELEAHFNAEHVLFLQKVDEQIRALESAEKLAAELSVPNRAELYDDLATDFDAADQALWLALDTARVFKGELVNALKGKKAQPFKAASLTASVPTVDAAVVDRLNEVISRHNQACDDFAGRVSEARDRLALDMIAESLDEFIRLRDAVQAATAAIEPIQTEITWFTDQITRLEHDIREHQQPAEELNEDLLKYLGHGELQLTIRENGYAIMRNGVPADMLSEGEMTAIALLYFLKSLEDRGFDKTNGVVVLDHPVSSLDANALYFAFGFIRHRTQGAAQLFILTHNFAFYRQVRNWFHHMKGQKKKDVVQRPARFFMLECIRHQDRRCAAIRWIDPLLEKYESEYHYLFACVYRAAKASAHAELEQNYVLPNLARRVLEAFLAFRQPHPAGELWQKLQTVSFDEAKKTRILRFLHTHSHGGALGEPEHDISLLAEAQSILNDLLDLIKSADSSHFAALEALATASASDDE
ncbi:MAG: AAA family ATPase [Phycisphaerae bacterium]|nr:AAA family ATPase [Phycisphaerae bacterium]NUQ45202.1 AAA family ATPase [Phycisphaerae bacterium]